MTSKIECVNDEFKCPIFYNEKKVALNDTIVQDLELIALIDPKKDDDKPLLHHAYQPNSLWSKKVVEQLATHYTTDPLFLIDTQTLLMGYESNKDSKHTETNDEMMQLWDEIKMDDGFKDKYYYVDWKCLEFLNHSAPFLQAMSMYNMSSPVFSILVPFFILIMPFFIIQARGLQVTAREYVAILKTLGRTHAIGRLFTHFGDVSLQQKAYVLVSAGFYFFSIYQNIVCCFRFYKNMKKIHTYLEKTKGFCERSIEAMRSFLRFSKPLGSYAAFNASLEKQIGVLESFHKSCSKISKYAVNPGKIYEVGHILKTFYELYNDAGYNSAFLFAFGFHGYAEAIEGLQSRLKAGQMNYATMIQSESKKGSKGAFYAALIDASSSVVTNDIALEKSLIITGPNASGKTTLLKTALINVILTQQTGCGFYQSSHLPIYDRIHCYLNIPDTSGRDSLFQAEARRCKEIIDDIASNPGARHFCIFDELYSGTNPEEAVESATAFMKYLVKNEKVTCMLTTHFVKVCKRLKKHPKIMNVHLKTRESADPSGFEYTYKLGKGISTKKGGLKVLRDMNYPAEILGTFATF